MGLPLGSVTAKGDESKANCFQSKKILLSKPERFFHRFIKHQKTEPTP